MTMPVASSLWEQNLDRAHRILAHPFVQGLGTGALPISAFQAYIAQDAYYLEAFARAYARALADSPDRNGLYAFADLIGGALRELELHAAYAKEWHVELIGVEPLSATRAYTELLDSTARSGNTGLTCAAMTPCMRLYAFLGQNLNEQYPDANHRYASWIQTYADPAFEALATQLEALLNRYAPKPTPEIETAYRRAMDLEYDFFDAHLKADA